MKNFTKEYEAVRDKYQMQKACFDILATVSEPDEAIGKIVEIIAKFYDADRGYVFENNKQKNTCDNTFEWCREGVTEEIDNLKDIPMETVEPWFNEFKVKGEFAFANLEETYGHDEPLYQVLAPQNITALAVAPIRIDGEMIGFFGIDNPRNYADDIEAVRAGSGIIQSEILRRMKREEEERTKMNVINGLAEEYGTVISVNLDTDEMRVYKVHERIQKLYGDKLRYVPYHRAIDFYVQNTVHEEDRDEAQRLLKVENIRSLLADAPRFTGIVRNVQERYGEIKIVRIGENRILIGFADKDEEIRKEMQQKAELEQAKIEAENANEAKTSFLFNMSHDIRTPMNAIMGFRDLLEKHQEDPEKRAYYLHQIEESSTVLLSIINNVLEMARIEKGTIEVDEIAWSAEQFNDTLYSVFKGMMTEKGIDFTRNVDVENHYVLCDPTKLREVFLNILSNAYKYTEPGGKVHMELKELPSNRDGWVSYQTTITDTGLGMSAEFLPHIFEEFSRENTTTIGKIEGTGLGMPIVKRLVDFMDGTIEVYSEQGVGSKFVVTLPHKITDRSSLTDFSGVQIDPNLFKGKRVLLAEDIDVNAEIACAILGEAGFQTEVAHNGSQCVEMIRDAATGYYDLVLMDIQMPIMNGYEATRAIRTLEDSRKGAIPIIAMTANAFEEDKREAFRCGMNGHIAKPININGLMKELARILG